METAYRTKEVVSVTATDSHDRGNKTMLEHFLYINVVRNTTFMVAIFGLFPKPSEQMDKYSPQMTIAHAYLTFQDKSQQHSFNAILDSMIAQKTFFGNTVTCSKKGYFRSVQTRSLSHSGHGNAIHSQPI